MLTDDRVPSENPEDFFWKTYLDSTRSEDIARVQVWEGSTTGILTFTGLFAATVAAFLVESYKLLSPDTGDQTVVLLEHLLAATANTSSRIPVNIPPSAPFTTSSMAIITNSLWFSSLLIALVCALLATLAQEWARSYIQDAERCRDQQGSRRKHAFDHIYMRIGVDRYGMNQFITWIVTLVHLAVFLFACGLLVFLFPINQIVAAISAGILGGFMIIYAAASLLPLMDKSCPYRTPVSYLMAFVYWLTLGFMRISCRLCFRGQNEENGNYQSIIARRFTGMDIYFLIEDPRRALFAWEHSHPHVAEKDIDPFLRGLSSFVRLHWSCRETMFGRLCASGQLATWLAQRLRGTYKDGVKDSPSSSLVNNDIFYVVAALSERMFEIEVIRYGEDLEGQALTSSRFLDVMGAISQLADTDGPSRLSACLCLAYIRASLLKLCHTAIKSGIPYIREEEIQEFFHRASIGDVRLSNCNPYVLLLLLVTASFDGQKWHRWDHRNTRTLLALHTGDCCKSWRNICSLEGLVHLAACNALATVANLLDATDTERSYAQSYMHNDAAYEHLWNWGSSLRMPELHSSQKMPSSAFVSILCSAGLQEWLEPDSNFSTLPCNGPKPRYLTEDRWGKACLRALQKMAGLVDFETYFERAVMHLPLSDSISDVVSSSYPLTAGIADDTPMVVAPTQPVGRYWRILSPEPRSVDGDDSGSSHLTSTSDGVVASQCSDADVESDLYSFGDSTEVSISFDVGRRESEYEGVYRTGAPDLGSVIIDTIQNYESRMPIPEDDNVRAQHPSISGCRE